MTRPLRRITLHLSQIFLTLGLTFIALLSARGGRWVVVLVVLVVQAEASAVPEDDPAAGEVVRAEFDDDPVLGEDPDVVLAHLA